MWVAVTCKKTSTKQAEGIDRKVVLAEIEKGDWRLPCAVNTDAASALIPAILRDLLGADSGARAWAVNEAMSVLWHQGTIYRASAEVMALLPRMLLVEGMSDEALIELSYLIALLSLSALGATQGRSACGGVGDGQKVLASLDSSFDACLRQLGGKLDIQSQENLIVALMAIEGREGKVIKEVQHCPRLLTLAEQLHGAPYDRRWDIFEGLGNDGHGIAEAPRKE